MSFLRKNAVATLSSLARSRHAAGVAAFLPRYSTPAFSRTLVTNSHLKPRLAQKSEAEPSEHESRNVSQQPSSPGTKIFVGNIPFTTSQEGIIQHFSNCGEIESIRLHRHNVTGNFTGSATITFATAEAAKAAIDLHDVALDGRPLLVEEALQGFRTRETSEVAQGPRNPPSPTLFVGNLPYSTTKEDLEEFFEAHNVTAVRLGMDRETGESKGFGHVAFETVEAAQGALEALKGAELHGRRVKLDFAVERRSSESAAGGWRDRGAGGSKRREFGGRGSGRQGGGYGGRDGGGYGGRDGGGYGARDGGESGFGFRRNGGDQY